MESREEFSKNLDNVSISKIETLETDRKT